MQTRSPDTDKAYETRVLRAARLVQLAVFGLVLICVAQLTVRFILPTDGWFVIFSELDQPDWIFIENLVGAPSELQRDDELHAVDGLSVQGTATETAQMPPPNWRVGETVPMTVYRNGREQIVDVPVVNWTVAALWRHNIGDPEHLISFLGASLLFAVGYFTFRRRRELPASHALLLLCTAIFVTSLTSILPDGLSVAFSPTIFYVQSFFGFTIFPILLAPSLLAFTLLFPRPKRIIVGRPELGLSPYLIGLLIGIVVYGGGPIVIGWLATIGMLLLSVVSLIHSAITQRDSVSRAQMRWAVGGTVLGLVVALVAFPAAFELLPAAWEETASAGISVGFAIVGISLAMAVLRYHLFDIEIIVRRTLVYGSLTALLVLLFLASVTIMQSLFLRLTGQDSQAAIVLSTLLITATFNPLRRRLQRLIDRRFYRRRYNAQLVLERFALAARNEVDLGALEVELATVVRETMLPASISIWLNDRRGQ